MSDTPRTDELQRLHSQFEAARIPKPSRIVAPGCAAVTVDTSPNPYLDGWGQARLLERELAEANSASRVGHELYAKAQIALDDAMLRISNAEKERDKKKRDLRGCHLYIEQLSELLQTWLRSGPDVDVDVCALAKQTREALKKQSLTCGEAFDIPGDILEEAHRSKE